jgi:hypothetical protein
MNIDDIIAYESGELSEAATIKMFQQMIDDGSVWSLNGHYGRMAMSLINEGYCQHAEVPHTDFYGSPLPIRKSA